MSAALVASVEEKPRPHAVPALGPDERDRSERTRAERIAIQVAIALTIALVLVVGFAVYLFGLSGLSEHRTQTTVRKSFAHELSAAVAPIGPAPEGAPVAVLDIPQIGLHEAVVVEGTSARDLTNGPGHRADTVLPGQSGVCVVYARRLTFGGPFAHLMRLRIGDRFSATTGQGVSWYRVSSFGDSAHPAPGNSANRIVLTTGEPAAIPRSTVSVSADLVTTAQAAPSALPSVPQSQKGLTTDVGASLLTTLLWSQALLALAIGATVAVHRWSTAATYLIVAPLAIGVLWNLFENLACLLPNLY